MIGRSYVISADHRTIAFPHLFAGIEYSSNEPVAKTAAGIGPGVTFRRWFHGANALISPVGAYDLMSWNIRALLGRLAEDVSLANREGRLVNIAQRSVRAWSGYSVGCGGRAREQR